ncbi:hypothetical protein P5V15_007340 [Pogonomyrmex californicus]
MTVLLKSIVIVSLNLILRRLHKSRQFSGSFRRNFEDTRVVRYVRRVLEGSPTQVALYARVKEFLDLFAELQRRSFEANAASSRSVYKKVRPAISASDAATALLR